jgi:hypothetical protein
MDQINMAKQEFIQQYVLNRALVFNQTLKISKSYSIHYADAMRPCEIAESAAMAWDKIQELCNQPR